MISMGKSGGVYGSGNTGLPQAFSGGKKTQNNQKSIFGAKNSQSGIFGQKSGNSMFATKKFRHRHPENAVQRQSKCADAGGEQLEPGFHRYKFPELQ